MTKKRTIILLIGLLSLLALGIVMRSRSGIFANLIPSSDAKSEEQASTDGSNEIVLACTGRVEGESEAISVGAGIDGVIAEIRVKDGDQVAAGQVLALIERGELGAEFEAARAAVASAEASRRRLLTGHRTEEREEVEAEKEAIEAVLKQKRTRYERYEKLNNQGVISADDLDTARKDVQEAEAKLKAAQKREDFVKAEPLPEELNRADAEIRAAEKRQQAIVAMMEKCKVRAPITATVLRTNMKIGEAYSTFMPQPILTLSDTSSFHVRAEVDERDVAKISLGQKVLIKGDAFRDRKIYGVVSRISSQMGRKKVRTGDPAEKSDRDVLEVLIALKDRDKALVVGLRVTAQFLSGQKSGNPATP